MKSWVAFATLATGVLSESIGDKGSASGRCHIYYPGDYGACNSYQVSNKDTTGPCGDSVSNACISTFHPDMSAGGMSNCMNCYKLTITYKDNTSLCTYVKAVDTDGSDCKYEMSQIAWGNICPYVCQGDGLCAHKEADCPYGIIPQDPSWASMHAPESCAVQSYPLTWEVVDCNGGASGCGGSSSGGGGYTPTQAPYPPTQAPYYPPTQAPYYPPTQAPYYPPTQAPYYPPTQAPYNPTQAPPNPNPAPSPYQTCYAATGWRYHQEKCAPCSQVNGMNCVAYGGSSTYCHSTLNSCCSQCVSAGYCTSSCYQG